MAVAPYYSDDLVTIYHGDCREIDAWRSADVLVTDPPYGRKWRQGDTGKGRGWASDRHDGIANDNTTEARDAALTLWGSRRAVVFGDLMLAPPAGTKLVLIYDKGRSAGFTGAIAGFRRNVEAIYLLGKWPSGLGGRPAIVSTTASTGGNLARKAGHPHAKPLDVMHELVTLADEGQAIADPFAGSGSTLVAAAAIGRRAIGVEVDEAYCEAIALRLTQGSLFGVAAGQPACASGRRGKIMA